jgi:hypothetical protein
MMEVILMIKYKFKGKRKDNKEWVYGYYFYDEFIDEHYIIIAQEDNIETIMWKVEPETIELLIKA